MLNLAIDHYLAVRRAAGFQLKANRAKRIETQHTQITGQSAQMGIRQKARRCWWTMSFLANPYVNGY